MGDTKVQGAGVEKMELLEARGGKSLDVTGRWDVDDCLDCAVSYDWGPYVVSATVRAHNEGTVDYYYLSESRGIDFYSCPLGTPPPIGSGQGGKCIALQGGAIPKSKKEVIKRVKNLPVQELSNVVKRLRALLAKGDSQVKVEPVRNGPEAGYNVTAPGRSEKTAHYYLMGDGLYYGGERCLGRMTSTPPYVNSPSPEDCYMFFQFVSDTPAGDAFKKLGHDLQKEVEATIAQREAGR